MKCKRYRQKGFTPTPKFGVSSRSERGFTPHHFWKSKKVNLKQARNGAGFTLVELIVSVAIFSLVITVASSLFSTVLRSQRKSINVQNIQDNGRYLMNFMAKEIRMSDIENPDSEIPFLNISHSIHGDITYTFTGATGDPETAWKITRNGQAINSNQVWVEGRFFIDGKTGGDDEQPRVTMVMKVGTLGTKIEERAEINLQTTLSQRKLD